MDGIGKSMKTIKVARAPFGADHHSHTHWEVVTEDRQGYELQIPDDINAEIGMRWNGESVNITQNCFSHEGW